METHDSVELIRFVCAPMGDRACGCYPLWVSWRSEAEWIRAKRNGTKRRKFMFILQRHSCLLWYLLPSDDCKAGLGGAKSSHFGVADKCVLHWHQVACLLILDNILWQ